MNRFFRFLTFAIVFAVVLFAIDALSPLAHAATLQQAPAASTEKQAAPADKVSVEHETVKPESSEHQAGHGPNGVPEAALREESKEAAGEEGAEFKQSPMVRKLAKMTGLDPTVAYWIFITLNFVILAVLFWWVLSKKVNIGQSMRDRTSMIQKGMEDAKKASAEANARLGDIESRLAKLDGEVASLRSTAEADFATEEIRIKQAAEEDARRVVEAAEQEIASASKNAQRELKAFVAELSVDLATKKIKVDAAADQGLVRSFVDQLGKDGK